MIVLYESMFYAVLYATLGKSRGRCCAMTTVMCLKAQHCVSLEAGVVVRTERLCGDEWALDMSSVLYRPQPCQY